MLAASSIEQCGVNYLVCWIPCRRRQHERMHEDTPPDTRQIFISSTTPLSSDVARKDESLNSNFGGQLAHLRTLLALGLRASSIRSRPTEFLKALIRCFRKPVDKAVTYVACHWPGATIGRPEITVNRFVSPNLANLGPPKLSESDPPAYKDLSRAHYRDERTEVRFVRIANPGAHRGLHLLGQRCQEFFVVLRPA